MCKNDQVPAHLKCICGNVENHRAFPGEKFGSQSNVKCLTVSHEKESTLD